MASIIEEIVFESKTLPAGFEVLLEQKAADLFAICDQEDKGFVTKRDMQRLKDELPLGPDQLENVFDALDQDQNGYLTLEEFTNGFEGFLGLESVISKCAPRGLASSAIVVCRKDEGDSSGTAPPSPATQKCT